MCSDKKEIVLGLFLQIEESISLLQQWNKDVKTVDDYLLSLRPEIPWKRVMGMRDHIAHGYFDIDAELVFQTVRNNLNPLLEAVRFFIAKMGDEQ